MCTSWWTARCQWRAGEDIGSSDNLPILSTFTSQIRLKPIQHSAARWKRNNVDWSKFQEEVKNKMDDLMLEQSITKRILRFNTVLKDAAEIHVGK